MKTIITFYSVEVMITQSIGMLRTDIKGKSCASIRFKLKIVSI